MKNLVITILALSTLSCAINKNHQGTLNEPKVWNEGDLLHLQVHGETEKVQFKMLEGLQQDFEKVGDGKFEANINIPQLDSATFGYQILVEKAITKDSIAKVNYPESEEKYFIWEGKGSQKFDNFNKQLTGSLIDTTIKSQYLKTDRTISIYLPKDHQKAKALPMIVMMDGQMLKKYAPYVDYLITKKTIQPLVVVGLHSNQGMKKQGKMMLPMRFFEYVVDMRDSLYYAHQNFVLNEAIPYIIKSYPVSKKRQDHYAYGVSNGGAFCLQTAIAYPEQFNTVIAFSTVGYVGEFAQKIDFPDANYPNFYIAYGKYERPSEKNKKFVDKLKENKLNHQTKELACGHDHYMWKKEFLNYLTKIF